MMRIFLIAGLMMGALSFASTDANAWYCSATSKNGASGWGFNFYEAKAEQSAIADCRLRSKGQRCAIQYCW